MTYLPAKLTLIAMTGLLVACSAFATQPGERLDYPWKFRELASRMSASDYYTSKAQIALLEAAADGDAKDMARAVKAGADVNGVGREGMLPLYWALANRSLKGMQWLLEHGADPNKRTTIPADWSWKKVKPSPIILAVSYPEYYPGTGHDMPYLKLLLEHGGNANQKTSYGRTLLFGVHNIEQARLLLEHGADVNHQDIDGETALVDTIQGGAYDIALLLLKAGADPTIKEDKHGYTAIDDIQAFGMYTPYKSIGTTNALSRVADHSSCQALGQCGGVVSPSAEPICARQARDTVRINP